MEQQADRILPDAGHHVIEHVIAGQLVLVQRVAVGVRLQADALAQLIHIVDVVHPLLVDRLEQDNALQLADLVLVVELRFLLPVLLFCLLAQKLLELLLRRAALREVSLQRDLVVQRDDLAELNVEVDQIPLLRGLLVANQAVNKVVHQRVGHLHHNVAHVVIVQHAAALAVDDLALLIHDLVIFEDVLTDAEVVALDLLLRLLNRGGEHLVLDLLALLHAQRVEDAHQALGAEQAHQVILQGDIEAGFARIALAARTAAQLVVNAAGFVALGADDLQAAKLSGLVIQLDIGTAAGHVGSDRHGAVDTGFRDDLRLQLVVLCVQNLVRDAAAVEHGGQHLGCVDVDRADQHRLSLVIGLLHLFDDGVELFLLRLVDRILMVNADHRLVRRDRDDVHAVDRAELLFLGEGRSGHAGLLLKLVEEVLEGDGGQGLALPLDLHMLLGLNRLMQAVAVTAPRQDTAGELIDDLYLIVLHHVVLVAVHHVVGLEGHDDAVLDLQVLGVGQVADVEELLHLVDALLGEVDRFILLVDDEVAGLGDLLAHDRVHLGELGGRLALLQALGNNVADLVQLGGLAALARDDQRGSGLIDQDGVHLVDDGVVEAAEHQLLLVDDHVVAQIVESELVVRDIRDVTVVGLPALVAVHAVQDAADRQPEEAVHLALVLGVAVRQIIVDRDDIHALAFQRVEVGCQRSHVGLAFAGLHLRDAALVQDNTAHQLDRIVLLAQNPAGCLADHGEGLRQDVVQRFALCETLLEFRRLCRQLLIGHGHHLVPHAENFIDCRLNALDFMLAVCAEQFCHYAQVAFPPERSQMT